MDEIEGVLMSWVWTSIGVSSAAILRQTAPPTSQSLSFPSGERYIRMLNRLPTPAAIQCLYGRTTYLLPSPLRLLSIRLLLP